MTRRPAPRRAAAGPGEAFSKPDQCPRLDASKSRLPVKQRSPRAGPRARVTARATSRGGALVTGRGEPHEVLGMSAADAPGRGSRARSSVDAFLRCLPGRGSPRGPRSMSAADVPGRRSLRPPLNFFARGQSDPLRLSNLRAGGHSDRLHLSQPSRRRPIRRSVRDRDLCRAPASDAVPRPASTLGALRHGRRGLAPVDAARCPCAATPTRAAATLRCRSGHAMRSACPTTTGASPGPGGVTKRSRGAS